MAHEILDRPIAFHRAFVTLTGSVTAALMLSQAVYWQRRCKSDDGWWWKTREDWEEETGMSRKEQETARKRLSALGWWQEDRRGVPAKMFYRVDLDGLMKSLSRLDCPKVTNWKDRKLPTGWPESGNHLKEAETTTETTTESSQTSAEVRTAYAPNCPYEKLTELYRENFPDQRQPRTDISDRRKAIMRKGWLHASRLKKRDGSGLLYNGDPTGVTFWSGFMAWIAKHCEFCMQEQTNFDIEWLFTPRAIDNLIDGKYTKIRERKRA